MCFVEKKKVMKKNESDLYIVKMLPFLLINQNQVIDYEPNLKAHFFYDFYEWADGFCSRLIEKNLVDDNQDKVGDFFPFLSLIVGIGIHTCPHFAILVFSL